MNVKQIEYINPETGEVLTGTVQEVADKLGVSRVTLNKRLSNVKVDSNVNPNSNVKGLNNESLPVDISNVKSNVKPEVTVDEDDTEPSDEQAVEIEQPKTNRYVPEGAKVTNDGRILLAKGPCVKCGQIVYHRLNGQFHCFNSCSVIKKPVEKRRNLKDILASF